MTYKKPRFLFLNVYDVFALGPRYISSLLRKEGYDTHLLNFKLMITVPTSAKKTPDMKKNLREKYDYFIVQNFIRKKYFLPSDNPYTEKELELFIAYIEDFHPDFVCLSVHSANFKICRFLTGIVRNQFPGTRVIWGGIIPTYEPENALQYADIACRGEGEYPLLELARTPQNTNIENLWFKKVNGEIIKNPVRPLVENLDALPFPEYGKDELFVEDDHLSDLFREVPRMRNDHIYIQTSRGCPYQCSYCHNSYLKKKVYPDMPAFRQRSVDNVIKQVSFYQDNYNIQHVLFTDEIFIKSEPWIEEFAQKFQKIFLPFGGYCHPCMTSEKMLRNLQDIGMKQVAMGIQTGSERILKDVYHRRFGINPIKNMIEILDRLQFELVRYDLIVNNPYENREDYEKTFEMLMSINHTFDLAIFDLELFPFTELSEMKLPEFALPAEEREAWIILFLMTTIQGFSPSLLRSMASSNFLRKHPQLLRGIGFLFRNDDIIPPYFTPYKPYRVNWKKAVKNTYRFLFNK